MHVTNKLARAMPMSFMCARRSPVLSLNFRIFRFIIANHRHQHRRNVVRSVLRVSRAGCTCNWRCDLSCLRNGEHIPWQAASEELYLCLRHRYVIQWQIVRLGFRRIRAGVSDGTHLMYLRKCETRNLRRPLYPTRSDDKANLFIR